APLFVLGLDPITLSHCACVTSYLPISNAFVICTRCAGFSSALQSSSPVEQPIVNSPGWISTNSMPIEFFDCLRAVFAGGFWANTLNPNSSTSPTTKRFMAFSSDVGHDYKSSVYADIRLLTIIYRKFQVRPV